MYINRIFHVKDSRTESKIYTNSFIFGAVAIVAVVVVAFYFSVSFFFIARTPWARMRKSCCVNRGEMPEHRKAEKYVNCNYCVLCLNVSIYIVYNYSRNGRRGTTNNERTNVTNERRKKKSLQYWLFIRSILHFICRYWIGPRINGLFHFYNHRFNIIALKAAVFRFDSMTKPVHNEHIHKTHIGAHMCRPTADTAADCWCTLSRTHIRNSDIKRLE